MRDVAPAALPDLFAGESLLVQGRFDARAQGEIVLQGRAAGGAVRKQLRVELQEDTVRLPVRQLWARSRVADLMRLRTSPVALRPEGATDAVLQERVTRLGERYGLLTQWTALVAVSAQRYQAEPGASLDSDVPLPMVAGVGPAAYGQSAGWPAFTGAGTPEPGVWAGALALGLLGALRLWRWNRSVDRC